MASQSIFDDTAWAQGVMDDGDTLAGLGTDDVIGTSKPLYLNVMKAKKQKDAKGKAVLSPERLLIHTVLNDHWGAFELGDNLVSLIKAKFPSFRDQVPDFKAPTNAMVPIWAVTRGAIVAFGHFNPASECNTVDFDQVLRDAIGVCPAKRAIAAAITAHLGDGRALIVSRCTNFWTLNHATGSNMKTIAGPLGKKFDALSIDSKSPVNVQVAYAMIHCACPATTLKMTGLAIFDSVKSKNKNALPIVPAAEIAARLQGFPAMTRRLGLACVAMNYLGNKGLLTALNLGTSCAIVIAAAELLMVNPVLGHKGAYWLTGGTNRADIINTGEAIDELIGGAAGFMMSNTPSHSFLKAPSVMTLLKSPPDSFAAGSAAGKKYSVKAPESLIDALAAQAGLAAANAGVKKFSEAEEKKDEGEMAAAAGDIVTADKALSDRLGTILSAFKK